MAVDPCPRKSQTENNERKARRGEQKQFTQQFFSPNTERFPDEIYRTSTSRHVLAVRVAHFTLLEININLTNEQRGRVFSPGYSSGGGCRRDRLPNSDETDLFISQLRMTPNRFVKSVPKDRKFSGDCAKERNTENESTYFRPNRSTLGSTV